LKSKKIAIFYAILAAALYSISIPCSKWLLNVAEPTMIAAFLYLGAGLGLMLYGLFEKLFGKEIKREPLTKKELPYTLLMVLLDIAAPILLLIGISKTNAANASLLNNFEIVATSVIALVIFKEAISARLWIAITLVSVASAVLSFEGVQAFSFNVGSLFVLGACVCWGFENNCTRKISNKSSVEIVVIKGLFSGLGSLAVAFILGEGLPHIKWILCVMLLGFVAYGLSIHFYIMAQSRLGAARTSAYYSIAPFLGVAFGMLVLGARLEIQFFIGLIIMAISTYFMVKDTL
jgi:drug/metabolite transporter (DMT)-like permease